MRMVILVGLVVAFAGGVSGNALRKMQLARRKPAIRLAALPSTAS
jgi:hypothetical protein